MKVKKVLVVPLNWGLGHTSRLVPVIKELAELKADIFFGGNQAQIDLMRQEFQSLHYIFFPVLKIRLGREKYNYLSFLLQLPGFILQLIREHKFLNKIIEREGIELVIADNVYGLWNKKAYTIFLTHQLNLFLPKGMRWMQWAGTKFIRWCISKFDECWIPDVEGKVNLAGKLSQANGISENCKYIGILSRFDKFRSELANIPVRQNHVLIILSGPEPQRTLFEKIIARQIPDLPRDINYTIVRGLPDRSIVPVEGWKNHLPTSAFFKLMAESEYIICRSGYSTIMDLVTIGKTAFLVPTPGQTEQEYLAAYAKENGWFSTGRQEKFILNEAIRILQEKKHQKRSIPSLASSLMKESLLGLFNHRPGNI